MVGRLGIIIDGTGDDYRKINKTKTLLNHIGYDTYMIFVNTSLDIALERNQARDRTVPEYVTIKSWQDVQRNIGAFQNSFGSSNFIIVDNNVSAKELVTNTMNKVSKFVRQLMSAPVKNYEAKKWIARELELKRRK